MSLLVRKGVLLLQVLGLTLSIPLPLPAQCPPGVPSCPLPGFAPLRRQAPPAVVAPPVQPGLYPRPWQAAVRIHVTAQGDRPGVSHTGSGTIVISDAARTVILSCGHLFRTGPPASIRVDLFDGVFRTTGRFANQQLTATGETFQGRALDYDLGRDVSLVEIRPGRELVATPVAPAERALVPGEKLVAVGCDAGQDAIAWTTTVLRTDMLMASGVRVIECRYAPAQGRSGGGLHLPDGRVVGVCNWQDVQSQTGGYADGDSIRYILDRNQLRELAEASTPATFGKRAEPAPPAATPPATEATPGGVNVQVGATPPRAAPASPPDTQAMLAGTLGTVIGGLIVAAAFAARSARGLSIFPIGLNQTAAAPTPPVAPPTDLIATAGFVSEQLRAILAEIDRQAAEKKKREDELARLRSVLQADVAPPTLANAAPK